MNNVEISTDPARLDVVAIHAFLTQTYWSPGIPLHTVRTAIEHSVCVGAFAGDQQVGFARAITDHATFAYLADVYVLPERRGQGLSRRLLDALLQHPALQGLRRLLLITRDAHGLYAQVGFQALAAPDRYMELHRPQAYAAQAAPAQEPRSA